MTGKEFFDKAEKAFRSLCDDVAKLSPEEFGVVRTAISDGNTKDGVHSGSDIGGRIRNFAGTVLNAVENGYHQQDTKRGQGHAHTPHKR